MTQKREPTRYGRPSLEYRIVNRPQTLDWVGLVILLILSGYAGYAGAIALWNWAGMR